MAMVCSVYGSEHRGLKRRTLAFSAFDLLFISSTIGFVIVQLITLSLHIDSSPVELNVSSDSRANVSSERDDLLAQATEKTPEVALDEESIFHPPEHGYDDYESEVETYNSEHNEINEINCTSDECKEITKDGNSAVSNEEAVRYRNIIGARISLSIQLIIYMSQFGFGILLLIAAYHNDSQNLHLWVLFNEVIVVVVGLILFINFFGNFHWISAILTGLYIMFKVFLIRLVRRFIQVNDLQLTQFGSVGEFD